MIIIKIVGGLGNQLFQYAYGLALAKRNNTDLYLDLSWYETGKDLEWFGKHNDRPFLLSGLFGVHVVSPFNILKYIRKVKETQFQFDQSLYDLGNNHYIRGYFQSEQYFDNIKDEMKSISRFGEFYDIRRRIKEGGFDTAIHVRRSDYLTNPVNYVLPETYYREAKEILESKKVIVFSDDPDYSDWNSIDPIHDMIAMSCFPKIITANSSYSWWAAWLSDAQVVCPKKYFATGHDKNMSDFWPKTWIQI